MRKFWNWIKNEEGERTLRLEGPIDEDDFWGNAVNPKAFRAELESGEGDITVWINSPGGSVFCAAEIYTMLCDYKGKVTVKIDAIAASAASVIAMAGDRVLISPVGMMLIHDPMTMAMGNTKDMEKAITTLNEVKASIINAYHKKTGLSRNKISQLMENETWMNAKKAVELGFVDEILFENKRGPMTKEKPDDPDEPDEEPETDEPDEDDDNDGEEKKEKKPFKMEEAMWQFSSRLMGKTILNRIGVEPGCGDAAKKEQPEACEKEIVKDTDDSVAEPAVSENDGSIQIPVIGMDGKTKDGSMPYEILKAKLEWLR